MPTVRSVTAASTASGVEAEGRRVDVREDRRGAGERDRVGRRRERERRDDDLLTRADAGRQQTEVLPGGARVDGDAGPAGPTCVGELLLERGDLRALGEHAAAQHAVDRGTLLVADERLGRRDERSRSVVSVMLAPP